MTIEMEYNDLLKILSKQMEDSGIRNYCKTICHGRCCYYVSQPCEMKECEKKVSCANFLCSDLLFFFL